MLKAMCSRERTSIWSTPVVWSHDSGIWHCIPENFSICSCRLDWSLALRLWNRIREKNSIPINTKLCHLYSSPECDTVHTHICKWLPDFCCPVPEMQAAVSFLPSTTEAFLLHYWQPQIEEYLMCRTPSSEIPICPFYLMIVGLWTSNNTKYLSPANDLQ